MRHAVNKMLRLRLQGEKLEDRRLLSIEDTASPDAISVAESQRIPVSIDATQTPAALQSDFSDFSAVPPNWLDKTFGGTGIVATAITRLNDTPGTLAVQPDGKLVVAGLIIADGHNVGALLRYTADGAVDLSFGTVTFFPTTSSYVTDVVVQPDGKILAVGAATIGDYRQVALARYNADGSFDTTFGSGGQLTVPLGNRESAASGVALQADGAIVIAGYIVNETSDFLIVRLTSNGELDATFGTGGVVSTPISTVSDRAVDVAITSDGRIMVLGNSSNGISEDDDIAFALARYNANGTLDTTFGSNGKLLTHVVGFDNLAKALAIQPDGKIVVAGYLNSASGTVTGIQLALVRYNSDGTLDNSFGDSGYGGRIAGSTYDILTSLALLPDGRILAAGRAAIGPSVYRYLSTGSPDESFGVGGKWMAAIGVGTVNGFEGIAALPDGRFVAAGYATFETTKADFVAARFLPEAAAEVAGQYVFYGNSVLGADDDSIATDKSALFPGGTATFANYTSYVRGINGLSVDIAGAAMAANISTDDFVFRVGNDNLPDGWTQIQPTSLDVRMGAGVAGSDRVTVRWTDGAIANQWLQVTVRATAATGLHVPFVFYFGNAIADSGDSNSKATVNATDEIGARGHATAGTPALVDNVYDYNRDGIVDTADELLSRSHHTTLSTSLKLIHPPAMQTALALRAPALAGDEPSSYGAVSAILFIEASRATIAPSPVRIVESRQLSLSMSPAVINPFEQSRATDHLLLTEPDIAENWPDEAATSHASGDGEYLLLDVVVAELTEV